ncbi:MAG: 4'-phosphopantetheinyl transferase superfamily protein [Planctomycetota bacterium]
MPEPPNTPAPPQQPPNEGPLLPDWPVRRPADAAPSHRPGHVQVWAWSLREEPSAAATAVLAADELQRAGRLKFAKHRRRFVQGRAGLRVLLGAATGTAPGGVAFEYGPHGKPCVEGLRPSVAFNASHTGDLAVAAVAIGAGALGIDVEAHRPCRNAEAIATRHFTPAEARACLALDGADRTTRFFDLWSAKEAVIKLLGSGLTLPLTAFETPAAAGRVGEVLLPEENALGIARCWLQPIAGAPGCAAALACVAPPAGVTFQLLDPATLRGESP